MARRDSIIDDFRSLANAHTASGRMAEHIADLLESVEAECNGILQKPPVARATAAIRGGMEDITEHINDIERQVELLREQLHLDRKKHTRQFEELAADIAKQKAEIAATKATLVEKRTSAALFVRQLVIELENAAIEAATKWTPHQRRVDFEISGMYEFQQYCATLSAEENASLIAAAERALADLGATQEYRSVFDRLRQTGNGYAHERLDLVPIDELKVRVTNLESAYPLQLYSSSTGGTIAVPLEQSQMVTSLYMNARAAKKVRGR